LSSEKWRINKKAVPLLLIRKLVGAHLSGASSNLLTEECSCGANFERKCYGYKDNNSGF
jgi:hypothetical protein